MLSEPRTINLLAELIHLPSKHSAEGLRQLYNGVCTSCGYENFIRTADGARLESPNLDDNQVSSVVFRQDRIQFTEDHTPTSLEAFVLKVQTVAEGAMGMLGIPIYLVQQTTVRSIASPNRFKYAGEFLAQNLFRIQGADVEPLGRPTSIIGLRLLFPPTKDHQQNFNVRIEAYLKDPRSVYIENVAVYKTPIQNDALAQIGRNIKDASDFVSGNVCNFLSQYDRKDAET